MLGNSWALDITMTYSLRIQIKEVRSRPWAQAAEN